MYIDSQTIIQAAAVLAAFSTIGGIVLAILKWIQRQNKQDEDIDSIKKENSIICYSLLCCLDGLEQLGANHSVPKAKEKLMKHLNLESHDQI